MIVMITWFFYNGETFFAITLHLMIHSLQSIPSILIDCLETHITSFINHITTLDMNPLTVMVEMI